MKLAELAMLFHVNTNYLLDMESAKRLDVDTLTDEECSIIYSLMSYFDKQKETE